MAGMMRKKMFDPNCPHCKPMLDQQSDGEPLCERFSSAFGMAVYDVDKAREIVKDGREIHEVPTIDVAEWVSYNLYGKLFFGRNYVSETHIDHVLDSSEDPVIFAYSLPREGEKRALMPIDGNHRIARAIKYSQPLVYAVVLSEEETDSILTDNRPRKPRKVRRTRKKTA